MAELTSDEMLQVHGGEGTPSVSEFVYTKPTDSSAPAGRLYVATDVGVY